MLWRDINFCFLSIALLNKRIDLVVKSKFNLLEVTQNKWVFLLKGWQYYFEILERTTKGVPRLGFVGVSGNSFQL